MSRAHDASAARQTVRPPSDSRDASVPSQRFGTYFPRAANQLALRITKPRNSESTKRKSLFVVSFLRGLVISGELMNGFATQDARTTSRPRTGSSARQRQAARPSAPASRASVTRDGRTPGRGECRSSAERSRIRARTRCNACARRRWPGYWPWRFHRERCARPGALLPARGFRLSIDGAACMRAGWGARTWLDGSDVGGRTCSRSEPS